MQYPTDAVSDRCSIGQKQYPTDAVSDRCSIRQIQYQTDAVSDRCSIQQMRYPTDAVSVMCQQNESQKINLLHYLLYCKGQPLDMNTNIAMG